MVTRLEGAIANGDLSTRQFTVVRLTGTTTIDFEVGGTTAQTQQPIGILLNDPNTSGSPAEVGLTGVMKVRLGGVVSQGNNLSFGNDGRVTNLALGSSGGSSGRYVIGQALQGGTSGEVRFAVIHQPYILGGT